MNGDAVIAAMQRYGGSFAKSVALAARCAAPDNLRRLQAAFPELWERYEPFARRDAEEASDTAHLLSHSPPAFASESADGADHTDDPPSVTSAPSAHRGGP